MNDFWKTLPSNVGGPLTQETWDAAMRAIRKQSDAYYRDSPPVTVYPAWMVKK